MPVYEYKCDECGTEREVILPFSEAGKKVDCECGRVMRRKFSLVHFSIPETGRKKVLDTLNSEPGGRRLPGGHKHSERYEAALAKGLDQRSSQLGQYRPVKGAKA